MADEKFFYAKFKINPDVRGFDDMFVSEDRIRIDMWPEAEVSKVEDDKRAEKPHTAPRSPFATVAKDYAETISTFRDIVPYIMARLPFFRRFDDDKEIREFVEANGEKIESGEFETYKVNVIHLPTLNSRTSKSNALGSGLQNLPALFLVGLVSAYDVFFSSLIRTIFLVNPDMLSSSERNISFRDLIEIGSVEAARERIIDKEVEAIIRQSHSDHIKWLESRLKITISKDLLIWPDFIEICERRNLLTHTGGRVSQQYIQVCRDNGFNTGSTAVGSILEITNKYYSRAVAVFEEFGMKLAQVVWRKLVPSQALDACRELDRYAYSLIDKRSYEAAATILKFGLYEIPKQGSEAIRKQMIVNYANAVKLGGNAAQAVKILDAEDWSASEAKFIICVAAIKDDIEAVLSMMSSVVTSRQLSVQDLQIWAVFLNMRKEARFIEAFEREFGAKLIVEQRSRKGEKDEAESLTGEDVTLSENEAETGERTVH